MTVRWLSAAESDFSKALEYYLDHEHSPVAATAFADEIDSAIRAVQNSPLTFPRLEGEVRVKLLHRFPFSLLYLADGHEIVIHSLVHQERKPGYWKDRV